MARVTFLYINLAQPLATPAPAKSAGPVSRPLWNKKMNLLTKSIELSKWVDKKLNGLEVSAEEKNLIATSCYDIAIENQKAIPILIERKLYGSAFSLVRVQFEAYIRGLWLSKCANQTEVDQFKKNKIKKTFAELIQDIENIDGYKNGVLSKAKTAGWGAMNSFTHTGMSQIARRSSATHIEPDYDQKEIEEVLSFSNAVSLLSIFEIAILAKNNDLMKSALEKIKEQ